MFNIWIWKRIFMLAFVFLPLFGISNICIFLFRLFSYMQSIHNKDQIQARKFCAIWNTLVINVIKLVKAKPLGVKKVSIWIPQFSVREEFQILNQRNNVKEGQY